MDRWKTLSKRESWSEAVESDREAADDEGSEVVVAVEKKSELEERLLFRLERRRVCLGGSRPLGRVLDFLLRPRSECGVPTPGM